jgi:hypothetical protein
VTKSFRLLTAEVGLDEDTPNKAPRPALPDNAAGTPQRFRRQRPAGGSLPHAASESAPPPTNIGKNLLRNPRCKSAADRDFTVDTMPLDDAPKTGAGPKGIRPAVGSKVNVPNR